MKTIHIIAILIGIRILLEFIPIDVWIVANVRRVNVKLSSLIRMRAKKVPVESIVKSYIKAKKSNVNVSLEELERHHLAGGNVRMIVDILIKAERVNMDISFSQVAIADLENSAVLKKFSEEM